MGNVSEQLATQKHSDDMKPSIKGTKFHSNISCHWRTIGRLSQEWETKVPSTKSHLRFHISSLQRGNRSIGSSPGRHFNQTIFLTIKVLPDSSFPFTQWESKLLAIPSLSLPHPLLLTQSLVKINVCLWPQKQRWFRPLTGGSKDHANYGKQGRQKRAGQFHAKSAFGSLGFRSTTGRL